MPRVIEVYFDINMSNGHTGLGTILEKDRKTLGDGQYAIFINKAWTALKMLTPQDALLHIRRPSHKPINPKTIPYLPSCVSGAKLNYDKALKEVMEREFGKYEQRYSKAKARRAAK